MPAAARPPVPEVPHVWRARDLACAVEKTVPTGHPTLDAQLPAGGWPLGSLIEILQQRFTANRQVDPIDFAADAVGALIAVLLPCIGPYVRGNR